VAAAAAAPGTKNNRKRIQTLPQKVGKTNPEFRGSRRGSFAEVMLLDFRPGNVLAFGAEPGDCRESL